MDSIGLIVFFIVVGVLGTAVAVVFSVDSLGEKFFSIFTSDKRE